MSKQQPSRVWLRRSAEVLGKQAAHFARRGRADKARLSAMLAAHYANLLISVTDKRR